tara:strand:- start:3219 stop:3965 length:747 start_codon:yes stop_codon:yes gene_type:complete
MLIKTIKDTELFKHRILYEDPYRLTYLFFCRITDECLYVGITRQDSNGKFTYIMNHHTCKSFRKNLDKYYLRIIFPNEIPYIHTYDYEGMFIGLFNTKLNIIKEMGAIETYNKYKIPYLEDIKPKEEEIINHINRCDLLEMFLQISHKDIYDKLYHMFQKETKRKINTKYDILKFCNFKDIVKSFNLIHNNIDLKHDEIVCLFLKHKLLDIDLWTDRRKEEIGIGSNRERFGIVDKQYLKSLILRRIL